jgi:hypothetical protein
MGEGIEFPTEMYSEALSMYKLQTNLLWRRLRAYLLLNGALFSIVILEPSRIGLLIVLCTFGVIFSLLWMLILKRAQEKAYRWGQVVIQLEILYKTSGEPLLFDIYTNDTNEPQYTNRLISSIFDPIPGVESGSVLLIPVVIAGFWILFLTSVGARYLTHHVNLV